MCDPARDGADRRRYGGAFEALLLPHILKRPIAIIRVDIEQSQEIVARTDAYGRPMFDEVTGQLLTTTRFGPQKATGYEHYEVYDPNFEQMNVIFLQIWSNHHAYNLIY